MRGLLRRSTAFSALIAVIAASAGNLSAASAAGCPALPPTTGDESELRGTVPDKPTDWLTFAFAAGAEGARVTFSLSYKFRRGNNVQGFVLGGNNESPPYVDVAVSPGRDQHSRVVLGNTVVERHGRVRLPESRGTGGGSLSGWRELRACEQTAVMAFVPGAEFTQVATSFKVERGAASSVLYRGSGGGVLRSADTTRGPAVALGPSAGRFVVPWHAQRGVVAGVPRSNMVGFGTWTTPNARHEFARFGANGAGRGQVTGPPGRWKLEFSGHSGSGIPGVASSVLAGWADIGPLRSLFHFKASR